MAREDRKRKSFSRVATNPQFVLSIAVVESLNRLMDRLGSKNLPALFDGRVGEVAESTISNWKTGHRRPPVDIIPILAANDPEFSAWLVRALDVWTGMIDRVVSRLDGATAEKVKAAYFQELGPGRWGRP